MEMKNKMEKKVTNIGLVAILVIGVFVAVMGIGIASAETPYYNESGNYIEGINVSVNTSDNMHFNRSCINVPLAFQINTLNDSATSFNVTNQSGLTTNATGGDLAANECFWVNATKAGTYWVNVSNSENQSEYVNFTVEYSNITITTYNKDGNYIEGINVTVNTTTNFNMSNCCTPLEFLINNTLNESATSFNVTTHPGLRTNATAVGMDNDTWFWVNASIPGTYWVNVSNNENSSEYVNFTVEYSSITNTTYNKKGNYIEGINVSVNTSSDGFNMSKINDPLTFQINNTLNGSAANFSVANQSGLTTNATGTLSANDSFWVNATEAGTYCINVFNKDNQSEYVHFTVEYFTLPPEIITVTIEIKPETLNLRSKGLFTVFIQLPEGADINISTVECEGVGLADSKKRIDGDTFIAKFKRQRLVEALNETGMLSETGKYNVTLNVTGELDDGTPFGGNDTIRVINKERWGLGFLGNTLNEVKNWAKKAHNKFSTSDDDAIASSSDEVIVTVTETSTNTMHIINIDMSTDSRKAGPNTFVWAVAAVTIVVDDSDSQVEGAKVPGHWSGATSDRSSGVTDANGQVSLESDSVRNPSGETTFTFTVDDVVKTDWTYNSSANEETSDSITV